MVHHIVCWNFKEELSLREKNEAAKTIKEKLEAIKPLVPGTIEIHVETKGLPSGNREIALISKFESIEALNAYQVSDAHIEAGIYIKSVVCDRVCFDYKEE